MKRRHLAAIAVAVVFGLALPVALTAFFGLSSIGGILVGMTCGYSAGTAAVVIWLSK